MNKAEVNTKLKDNKLPEGWKRIRLEEVAEYEQPQKYIVSDERYDKSIGIPVLTAGKSFILGYTDEQFGICKNLPVIIFDDFTTDSRYINFPFKLKSSAIKILKIRDNGYNLFFIYNVMQNLNFKPGSGHKRFWISEYSKISILYPPLPEQQKIAEILEIVDEAIEKTDAIIEKYKRIKQGLMQDLLTRGITAFEFEKDKLIAAVKKVFKNGDHRFGREENLVSHLSRHLNEFFLGWNVDSEVEKNNKRQRPDIIVHKRGTDKNLFAIEVKKNDNLNAIKEDIKKLEHVMLGDYQYEDAVFIGFDIDNFEEVFKLSEKVNFILVSKNGEIKVKFRVRRFKDSPLGRIPEEWEAHQIADVANVTKLAGFEFTNYFRYRDDGEIIALRALNIKNRKLDLTDIQRIKKKVSEQLPRSQVNAGDILITYIGAYIGDTLLIKESNKYHLAPNVAKITTKSIILPEFLEIFLSSYIGKRQYKQLSTLTATPSLTMTQIRKIIIFFSTEKEQHRIFSILSQIDETIEKEQNYKEKLERIKQGLMEDLLTGKVRVNHLIKEGVESV